VTLGSEVEDPAVCDTAAPPRAQSNAVDRMATAEGATKPDDNRPTISFRIRDGFCRPNVHDTMQTSPNFRIGPLMLTNIFAGVAAPACQP
jgi:hypothetical protein